MSWHLPVDAVPPEMLSRTYGGQWDKHTTPEKNARIQSYLEQG